MTIEELHAVAKKLGIKPLHVYTENNKNKLIVKINELENKEV
jgi:hypothetical protein